MKQGTGVKEAGKGETTGETVPYQPPDWKEWPEKGYIFGMFAFWLVRRTEQPYATSGLRYAEFHRLIEIADNPDEREWRNAFLGSLVKDGLLGNPSEITLEDTKKIIFMQQGEEKQWRSKLTQRKTFHEPQPEAPETHIQPESWPERLKSSDHQFIKKASLQVPMHPEMREQVAALAASYGLGSGEFAEEVLAEKLAQSPDRVKEGRELMAKEEFKRPYRAKLHILRKEIEDLRREKSPQRG